MEKGKRKKTNGIKHLSLLQWYGMITLLCDSSSQTGLLLSISSLRQGKSQEEGKTGYQLSLEITE